MRLRRFKGSERDEIKRDSMRGGRSEMTLRGKKRDVKIDTRDQTEQRESAKKRKKKRDPNIERLLTVLSQQGQAQSTGHH